jgi:hypothetical protein
MEIWQPDRLASGQRATPQRCPEPVGLTVQPASSSSAKAASTPFFGWRTLDMLTPYNECWFVSTA